MVILGIITVVIVVLVFITMVIVVIMVIVFITMVFVIVIHIRERKRVRYVLCVNFRSIIFVHCESCGFIGSCS